jgi:hypothetical protein
MSGEPIPADIWDKQLVFAALSQYKCAADCQRIAEFSPTEAASINKMMCHLEKELMEERRRNASRNR